MSLFFKTENVATIRKDLYELLDRSNTVIESIIEQFYEPKHRVPKWFRDEVREDRTTSASIRDDVRTSVKHFTLSKTYRPIHTDTRLNIWWKKYHDTVVYLESDDNWLYNTAKMAEMHLQLIIIRELLKKISNRYLELYQEEPDTTWTP